MSVVLRVEELAAAYGEIQALREVSLEASAGEIVTILGANGAGKTTLLKTVAGVLRPRAGRVTFAGERIERLSAGAHVRRGLLLVPEGRGIFTRMTVWENLLLGGYGRQEGPRALAAEADAILARFPLLAARRTQPAGVLSGGEQQLLAIARALMARPRLLMLDEPSLGLAPRLVREILELIATLRAQGLTILLVEQRARQALKLADRCYIMVTGQVVASGPAARFLDGPELRDAYLRGGLATAGAPGGGPQAEQETGPDARSPHATR